MLIEMRMGQGRQNIIPSDVFSLAYVKTNCSNKNLAIKFKSRICVLKLFNLGTQIETGVKFRGKDVYEIKLNAFAVGTLEEEGEFLLIRIQ